MSDATTINVTQEVTTMVVSTCHMTVLTSYLPLCVYSEDSCEDMMSSGDESLSSSLGSDAEGSFFPPHLRRQNQRQYLYA